MIFGDLTGFRNLLGGVSILKGLNFKTSFPFCPVRDYMLVAEK